MSGLDKVALINLLLRKVEEGSERQSESDTFLPPADKQQLRHTTQ